jgi:hypothetical protein
MSRYLVDRIAALPNVEVLVSTEVAALEGENGVLEAVRWIAMCQVGQGEAAPEFATCSCSSAPIAHTKVVVAVRPRARRQ